MLRKLSLASACALVLQLLIAAPTYAADACTMSGSTLTVNRDAEQTEAYEVYITRVGDDIELIEPNGFITITCVGGDPTVNNVDKIQVLDGGGGENVGIDMSGGGFEPGATPETLPNISEIEFDMAMGAGNDIVVVNGSPGNDSWTLGTSGVNFNPDTDVDLDLGGVDVFHPSGAAGNDSIDFRGGAGTGGEFTKPSNPRGDAGNDTLFGTDGPDVMQGGADDDVLRGFLGGDDLDGGLGDDQLFGGPGDETFYTGNAPDGADVIDGGGGPDELIFNLRTSGVRVTLDGVADDGQIAPPEGDNITNIASITGSQGDDELRGTSGRDSFLGLAGSDQMFGAGEDDYFNPGQGDDEVHGGDGRDYIFSNATGPDGADLLDGGPGPDAFSYDTRTAGVRATNDGVANDGDIATTEGDDITSIDELTGGKGNDVIEGTGGNDELGGGPGNDVIRGLAGHDDLVGGMGDDSETGGPGFDTFAVGKVVDGSDEMFGGDDRNIVDYSSRNRGVRISLDGIANDGSIAAGEQDNVISVADIRGGDGDDVLKGGADRDDIEGYGGDDRISGGGNGDDISGGGGDDQIDGGADIDVVNAGPGRDIVRGGDGRDDLFTQDGTKDQVYGGPGDDRGNVDIGLDFLNSVEYVF